MKTVILGAGLAGTVQYRGHQCALQRSDRRQLVIVVGGLPVHDYRAEDAVA